MTNASRITCRVLILLASPNLISSEENAITAVLPMAVPVETLCDRRSKTTFLSGHILLFFCHLLLSSKRKLRK